MPISIKGNGYVNPTITVHPVTPQNTITVNSSTPESQEINTNPLYGPTGNGISNIEKTSTSGVTDTYTIYFTNGTTTTFTVTNGAKGDTGNGIANAVLNDDYTLTLTFTDGTTYTTSSIRGETGATGETGNGIASIEKTDTTGLVDTYTITYTNGDTDTFTVTNGEDGEDGQDGSDGQDGADGYSPTATVSKSGNTATITITDKNGTTTETITDGADGQDGQNGQDGADGYSPTATVTKSGSVATITITDKNGTTSTTISDGVGAVSSVNGMSGDVTLTASDVGAQPAGNYVTTDTTQTISGVKTYKGAVHFIGSGDTNAVFISTNTRFDVEGTTRTVLGFGSNTFYINHTSYELQLRGSGTRPKYNSSSYLALTSDIPDDTSDLTNGAGFITGITSSDVTTALGYTPQAQLVSGTNIKTINNNSILGSGNLTLDGLPSQTGQSGKFLTTNGTTASWATVTIPTPTYDSTNERITW